MPASLYGNNYDLDSSMDLREHYIANDYQTTHVNSAFPHRDGEQLLISTLIQGAIGSFRLSDGSYREFTRGFVGAHGARLNDEGEIYFADSVTGCLVILNEDGTIRERFATGSRWLHDVQQIEGPVYAFAVSDMNAVCLYNIKTEELLFRRRFAKIPMFDNKWFYALIPLWLGNSTQFLSYTSSEQMSSLTRTKIPA